jgi:hypothetical protein
VHGWRKQFGFAVACNNFCKTGLSQIKLSHVEAVAENVLQPSNRFQAHHRAATAVYETRIWEFWRLFSPSFLGCEQLKTKRFGLSKRPLSLGANRESGRTYSVGS